MYPFLIILIVLYSLNASSYNLLWSEKSLPSLSVTTTSSVLPFFADVINVLLAISVKPVFPPFAYL